MELVVAILSLVCVSFILGFVLDIGMDIAVVKGRTGFRRYIREVHMVVSAVCTLIVGGILSCWYQFPFLAVAVLALSVVLSWLVFRLAADRPGQIRFWDSDDQLGLVLSVLVGIGVSHMCSWGFSGNPGLESVAAGAIFVGSWAIIRPMPAQM
jgi:hypothetical protein